MKNLWKINFFHHFLELTLNHAQSCIRVKKLNILEKNSILYSKIIIFWWKTYDKLTFFIIFNFAKTPNERTDWHKHLKFGMWHHRATPNPTISPPPHPYQFLQKLLMREQIDFKTWNWYVTPQCHLKLRIKPTPPVNFAKIPHERMDWHKDLKFGMWHHKNIFSLSFQKWSLWGVPKNNLEKCSISYSKIVILGCKD